MRARLGARGEDGPPAGSTSAKGGRGEDLAARYLKGRGFRILDRNWRGVTGEIDLVARDRGELVFVEVKSAHGDEIDPLEQMTRAKRRRLVRAAEDYLRRMRRPLPARFDVVLVDFRVDPPRVEHLRDAFGDEG
ncbi:MAG: YraN family protein [Myxococcales bacterium]|nr:YraN family protein [Myxococcales bacterium]